MRDKNDYISILQRNKGKVTFVKKDKSIRTMVCTLRPDLVPETGGGVATAKSNPDNVVVYDLENKGWRCFNITRVISLESA